MILLEVVEAERRLGKVAAALNPVATRRHPETLPQQPSSPRLPDYATSQAQAEGQPKEDVLKKPTKWNEKRIGRAIIYALAIYLVLSISIAVPLFIVLRNKDESSDLLNDKMNWVKSGPPPPPPPNILPPDFSDLPSVYGTPIECNNWSYISGSGPTNGYYKLQYVLPSNETIYLRSNFSEIDDEDIESPVTGSLNVSVLDSATQTDATVSVAMKDIGEDALKEANVCLVRTDDGWGLAIYVPDDANEDNYYFDVELALPLPQDTPLLKSLATYLPSFNQTFKQLDSYNNLESFIVQGSLGSINIESVHAESILVKTSAASISGTFNGSDKVILETVLAPVTVNVSLYNEGNLYPTHLDIESGSSDIFVNVTLHSNTNGSSDCKPMFMSNLKTFSGAIEAAYNHEPSLLSSILFVRATSSLEPARVFVDNVFEGTYDVHTTLSDAVLDKTLNVTDPTGAGRDRIFLDEHVSTNRALGYVGWESPPMKQNQYRQGHIEVVSSLSTAVLQLTDVPDISRLTSSKVSKAVISQASYP